MIGGRRTAAIGMGRAGDGQPDGRGANDDDDNEDGGGADDNDGGFFPTRAPAPGPTEAPLMD